MKITYTNKTIFFHKNSTSSWREDLKLLANKCNENYIDIDSGECILNCKDLNFIINQFIRRNIEIKLIFSKREETIISGSSLGLNTFLIPEECIIENTSQGINVSIDKQNDQDIMFHKGTLRAGERLEATNDVLIAGDVNPGAIVLAGGNIMIWGRLRGVAHAGKEGNSAAKITALQLTPLQLRIADKVARGPKGKPEEGLVEEALIEEGIIVIKPARSTK